MDVILKEREVLNDEEKVRLWNTYLSGDKETGRWRNIKTATWDKLADSFRIAEKFGYEYVIKACLDEANRRNSTLYLDEKLKDRKYLFDHPECWKTFKDYTLSDIQTIYRLMEPPTFLDSKGIEQTIDKNTRNVYKIVDYADIDDDSFFSKASKYILRQWGIFYWVFIFLALKKEKETFNQILDMLSKYNISEDDVNSIILKASKDPEIIDRLKALKEKLSAEEKISLEERKKNKKKDCSSITYTTGDIQKNIDHFNMRMGTADAPSASADSGAGGEGGAMGESLSVNQIEEDIEKHDKLNPKLFVDDKMIPEVREKLLKIVNEFVEGVEKDEIPITVKDIQIVGSNASYNYTKDSDIDLHVIVDMSELDNSDNMYTMLYNAYKTIWNSKYDITTHEIPTEIYVETDEASNVSNGCYSVLNDEWVREPVQANIPEFDQETFDKAFAEWENRYNEIVNSEDELEEEIHTPKIDAIDQLIQDIYELRKTGLATEGEYGQGNLIFKEFRNRGYLDRLKDLKAELISNELSLENLQEDTVKQNGKWVNKGDSGETHGEFKTKKAADAQRKAMFANGYKEELELDEHLNERQRREYKEELDRISFNQAIVQDNGLFNIYNVKENDVNRIINRLRDLDYIDWVNKNAGKYDFSKVAMFGQPQARYYNITGKIKI